MARLIGSKDTKPRKKKGPVRFCPKGHDTFLVGRPKNKHCRVCDHEYYLANKKRIDDKNMDYYRKHSKEIKIKVREWQLKNHDHIAAYVRNRRNENLNFKIITNLRSRLTYAVKHNLKVGSAVKDLGCSIDFLKQHIQFKFYGDMAWDNWGTIWELDHITPLRHFDLTDRKQFKQA